MGEIPLNFRIFKALQMKNKIINEDQKSFLVRLAKIDFDLFSDKYVDKYSETPDVEELFVRLKTYRGDVDALLRLVILFERNEDNFSFKTKVRKFVFENDRYDLNTYKFETDLNIKNAILIARRFLEGTLEHKAHSAVVRETEGETEISLLKHRLFALHKLKKYKEAIELVDKLLGSNNLSKKERRDLLISKNFALVELVKDNPRKLNEILRNYLSFLEYFPEGLNPRFYRGIAICANYLAKLEKDKKAKIIYESLQDKALIKAKKISPYNVKTNLMIKNYGLSEKINQATNLAFQKEEINFLNSFFSSQKLNEANFFKGRLKGPHTEFVEDIGYDINQSSLDFEDMLNFESDIVDYLASQQNENNFVSSKLLLSLILFRFKQINLLNNENPSYLINIVDSLLLISNGIKNLKFALSADQYAKLNQNLLEKIRLAQDYINSAKDKDILFMSEDMYKYKLSKKEDIKIHPLSLDQNGANLFEGTGIAIVQKSSVSTARVDNPTSIFGLQDEEYFSGETNINEIINEIQDSPVVMEKQLTILLGLDEKAGSAEELDNWISTRQSPNLVKELETVFEDLVQRNVCTWKEIGRYLPQSFQKVISAKKEDYSLSKRVIKDRFVKHRQANYVEVKNKTAYLNDKKVRELIDNSLHDLKSPQFVNLESFCNSLRLAKQDIELLTTGIEPIFTIYDDKIIPASRYLTEKELLADLREVLPVKAFEVAVYWRNNWGKNLTELRLLTKFNNIKMLKMQDLNKRAKTIANKAIALPRVLVLKEFMEKLLVFENEAYYMQDFQNQFFLRLIRERILTPNVYRYLEEYRDILGIKNVYDEKDRSNLMFNFKLVKASINYFNGYPREGINLAVNDLLKNMLHHQSIKYDMDDNQSLVDIVGFLLKKPVEYLDKDLLDALKRIFMYKVKLPVTDKSWNKSEEVSLLAFTLAKTFLQDPKEVEFMIKNILFVNKFVSKDLFKDVHKMVEDLKNTLGKLEYPASKVDLAETVFDSFRDSVMLLDFRQEQVKFLWKLLNGIN